MSDWLDLSVPGQIRHQIKLLSDTADIGCYIVVLTQFQSWWLHFGGSIRHISAFLRLYALQAAGWWAAYLGWVMCVVDNVNSGFRSQQLYFNVGW